MAETEIENSEKKTFDAGNERRFHEGELAFLGFRWFDREDFSDEQDEQAQDPQHQHGAGHAYQR
jgi:hypothetical protein